eukprot:scaffold111516_cov39-Phaeocystis_antarctica.AAC.4
MERDGLRLGVFKTETAGASAPCRSPSRLSTCRAMVGWRQLSVLERLVQRVGVRRHLRDDLGGRRRACVAPLLRVVGAVLAIALLDVCELDQLLDRRLRAGRVTLLGGLERLGLEA